MDMYRRETDMPTQNRQEISEQLREHADAVWNDGDIDAAGTFFAEDAVVHNEPQQNDYEGLDAFKQWVSEIRTAFPDFEVETTSVIVGDGRVASEWVASGTHEGEMAELDIPPTNNHVTWKGATVYKLDGDEVTEAWWYYDMAGILTQLGVIPEAPSA
jgi:steroid delta-isomerase-like uncharacterized protein